VGGFLGLAIPRAVSRSIGTRGSVPVILRVAGDGRSPASPEPGRNLDVEVKERTSLLPDGQGGHFVYLNGKVRRAARIELGDRVRAEVHVDVEPRGADMPEDLEVALREEGVLEAWFSIAAGMRFQLLRWVDQAVHDETRAKRVVRLVERAHARREKLVDGETTGTRRRRSLAET
jgi:hypothetical protein